MQGTNSATSKARRHFFEREHLSEFQGAFGKQRVVDILNIHALRRMTNTEKLKCVLGEGLLPVPPSLTMLLNDKQKLLRRL